MVGLPPHNAPFPEVLMVSIGAAFFYWMPFPTSTTYILSVYSPFSDKVGLPLHDTPFPGVLMKSIGAAFCDRVSFLMSTTCVGCNMCYVFNVNVTDSFNERRSQCRLI